MKYYINYNNFQFGGNIIDEIKGIRIYDDRYTNFETFVNENKERLYQDIIKNTIPNIELISDDKTTNVKITESEIYKYILPYLIDCNRFPLYKLLCGGFFLSQNWLELFKG